MTLENIMSYESYKNDLVSDEPLLYRAYAPKEVNKKYKVFIFLHGAGERGNDNKFQIALNTEIISHIINHPIHGKNTICIAPQVPLDQSWIPLTKVKSGSYDYDLNKATPIQEIFTDFLLNELPSKYNIDKENIFISGISMGASGAFDYLVRFPSMFKKAVLICGIMDLKKLDVIANIPLYLVHSKDDQVVPPGSYEAAFDALKTMGSPVKFKKYLDAGHASWVRAYNEPDLIDWIFT